MIYLIAITMIVSMCLIVLAINVLSSIKSMTTKGPWNRRPGNRV